MSVFDQPIMASNYSQREASAVPLQSLTMLNDPFVVRHAEEFATRVTQRAGPSPGDEILAAYQLALSRNPDDDERPMCRQLLDNQTQIYQSEGLPAVQSRRRALVDWCHTLLNTSEFLYAH